MTYQSASGAGAQNMRELLEQMGALHRGGRSAAAESAPPAILDIDRAVSASWRTTGFPTSNSARRSRQA